ncbi:hypothetical protein LWC34_27745 [Kibdelosporangium philippinense]|uniref:Uncharacterized protein n=1 Tax=Kibdelosporangium philippinense TaxID=211113 RepID=A0ABS8ZGZ2_9PSEU|nr:hypothetical protein [Kibdelosporangium philippinense]MCE7006594.1 hypothetical protein [Kibdelosporangium philippinense]
MGSVEVTLLVGLFVFLLGVLTGNGMLTLAQQQRERRQADMQRRINEEVRRNGWT